MNLFVRIPHAFTSYPIMRAGLSLKWLKMVFIPLLGFRGNFGVSGQFWGACAVSFHDHASEFQAGQVQPQRVIGKPHFPQDLPELP